MEYAHPVVGLLKDHILWWGLKHHVIACQYTIYYNDSTHKVFSWRVLGNK